MKKYIFLLGILVVVSLVCTSPAHAANTSQNPHFSAKKRIVAFADAQCAFNLPYPDPNCTPGAIFSNATADQVCTPGYSRSVRNVPQSEKNQVYAEYGIASHVSGEYEVDHFIPLELGGSNDISNLWPEPASPTPGFHEKDQVENYLHDQVCSGVMSLSDAQNAIANDWVAVYNNIPGSISTI